MDAARTDPDQDEDEVAARLDRGESPDDARATQPMRVRASSREDVTRDRDPETDQVLREEVRDRR